MCYYIVKNNRMCKNYVYRKNLCYNHYCKSTKKRVIFDESQNTTKIVSRYISDLPKLKTGLWKYELRKIPKRRKKNW